MPTYTNEEYVYHYILILVQSDYGNEICYELLEFDTLYYPVIHNSYIFKPVRYRVSKKIMVTPIIQNMAYFLSFHANVMSKITLVSFR